MSNHHTNSLRYDDKYRNDSGVHRNITTPDGRELYPVNPSSRGADPVLLNPLRINPNHLFDSGAPGYSVNRRGPHPVPL